MTSLTTSLSPLPRPSALAAPAERDCSDAIRVPLSGSAPPAAGGDFEAPAPEAIAACAGETIASTAINATNRQRDGRPARTPDRLMSALHHSNIAETTSLKRSCRP